MSGHSAQLGYEKIRRDWPEADTAKHAGAENHASDGSMMQRWLHERMRDQPYHAIDQVPVGSSGTASKVENDI
jgi:hypothetical protein